MLNSDSQKSPSFEESKDKKANTSKEVGIVVDDIEKLDLREDDTQVTKPSQSLITNACKYKLSSCSSLLSLLL